MAKQWQQWWDYMAHNKSTALMSINRSMQFGTQLILQCRVEWTDTRLGAAKAGIGFAAPEIKRMQLHSEETINNI